MSAEALIITEEKYSYNNLTGHHRLELLTFAVHSETKERILVSTVKIPLPKDMNWITKHQLWQHTDLELRELDRLSKDKGEKKPTHKTIEVWKSQMNKQV